MLGGKMASLTRLLYPEPTTAAQRENPMRIVALSVSLSNAMDLGKWIRADKHTIYSSTASALAHLVKEISTPPLPPPLPEQTHVQYLTPLVQHSYDSLSAALQIL